MFSFEEYIVDVFLSYQREYHISLHLLLLALSNLNLVWKKRKVGIHEISIICSFMLTTIIIDKDVSNSSVSIIIF